MAKNESQDNRYQLNPYLMKIRPRPLIRYLGGSIGVIVCLPIVIGMLWLLANPGEFVKIIGWGSLIPLSIQLAIGFMTYRWFRIGAEITAEKVFFRGWFRSLVVDRREIADIRKIHYESGSSINGSSRQSWRYEIFAHGGVLLGAIPDSMPTCKDWPEFLGKLNRLARENRDAFRKGVDDSP